MQVDSNAIPDEYGALQIRTTATAPSSLGNGQAKAEYEAYIDDYMDAQLERNLGNSIVQHVTPERSEKDGTVLKVLDIVVMKLEDYQKIKEKAWKYESLQ